MNQLNLYIYEKNRCCVLFSPVDRRPGFLHSQTKNLRAKCSIVSTMAFMKRRKYGSYEIYYACTCSKRANGNRDKISRTLSLFARR